MSEAGIDAFLSRATRDKVRQRSEAPAEIGVRTIIVLLTSRVVGEGARSVTLDLNRSKPRIDEN
jgi:hypothetical protein